jgi:hypothetical protein
MKLTVEAIPTPKGFQHPPAPHDALPKHEFTIGLIAPKGSGKTTVLCNLLKFYKGYFHSILVFSPTVANDDKWEWVKKQKLLAENKPLKKWLANRTGEENTVVEAPKMEVDMPEFEGGQIPEDCFFSEYDEETLRSVMDEQNKMITLLSQHGKSKHLANRLLIIFDDLVGSSLFSGKKNNPFKTLNANHRHYSASLLMVTQAYKEIPKTVRTQFSCLIVFEIPNDREVIVIYEENPMSLKQDQWYQVYNHAVDGDHNFMFINYQKPKRLRIMKNFSKVLFVDK